MNKDESPFSEAQAEILVCVLDELIPPSEDGQLPGAGELGLLRHFEETARNQADLGPAIASSVLALDELARARSAEGFAALSQPRRLELLNEYALQDPGFLPGLIFHAYVGYYQDPRVLGGLGMAPRPPHPEGYAMGSNDLSLLDVVRAGPRLYREC